MSHFASDKLIRHISIHRETTSRNTCVRKKSVSGHNVIAEATKAMGIVMAEYMQ